MDLSDSTMRRFFELIESMAAADRELLLEELLEREKTSKRKHPRKAYTHCVHYSDGEHFFKDVAQNISQGGVMITTSRSFTVGQHLSVVIPIGENGASFKFKGEVVWAKNDNIGIKFLGDAVSLTRSLKF